MKQNPGPPPERASAYEIAKKTNTAVDDVMSALSGLGEFVTSPRQKVEAPVIARVCSALGVAWTQEQRRTPSAWRTTDHDSRRQNQPATPNRPSSATAWRSRTRENAVPELAYELWKYFGFSEAERDSWVAHGIAPGDARIARGLRDAGLLASDLARDLYGWKVIKWVREQQTSPRWIVDHLAKSSA